MNQDLVDIDDVENDVANNNQPEWVKVQDKIPGVDRGKENDQEGCTSQGGREHHSLGKPTTTPSKQKDGNKHRLLNIEESLEASASAEAKEKINEILESVGQLSDREKMLLYLKLPTYNQPPDESLRQTPTSCLAGSSRAEQTAAYTWIRSHFEEDLDVCVPKIEVYEDYKMYCETHRQKLLCPADFGKVMKCVFPSVKPRRLGQRGQSRYCYSGLRKKYEVQPPTLPELEINRKHKEDENGEDAVFLASCSLVCEWAEKMHQRPFSSLQELAEHLLSNMYVQSKSLSAFTVLATMQDSAPHSKGSVSALSTNSAGGNKHREMQLQLQRKLQERENLKEQRKRMMQLKAENENSELAGRSSQPPPPSPHTATPTRPTLPPAPSPHRHAARNITKMMQSPGPRGSVSSVEDLDFPITPGPEALSQGVKSEKATPTPTGSCVRQSPSILATSSHPLLHSAPALVHDPPSLPSTPLVALTPTSGPALQLVTAQSCPVLMSTVEQGEGGSVLGSPFGAKAHVVQKPSVISASHWQFSTVSSPARMATQLAVSSALGQDVSGAKSGLAAQLPVSSDQGGVQGGIEGLPTIAPVAKSDGIFVLPTAPSERSAFVPVSNQRKDIPVAMLGIDPATLGVARMAAQSMEEDVQSDSRYPSSLAGIDFSENGISSVQYYNISPFRPSDALDRVSSTSSASSTPMVALDAVSNIHAPVSSITSSPSLSASSSLSLSVSSLPSSTSVCPVPAQLKTKRRFTPIQPKTSTKPLPAHPKEKGNPAAELTNDNRPVSAILKEKREREAQVGNAVLVGLSPVLATGEAPGLGDKTPADAKELLARIASSVQKSGVVQKATPPPVASSLPQSQGELLIFLGSTPASAPKASTLLSPALPFPITAVDKNRIAAAVKSAGSGPRDASLSSSMFTPLPESSQAESAGQVSFLMEGADLANPECHLVEEDQDIAKDSGASRQDGRSSAADGQTSSGCQDDRGARPEAKASRVVGGQTTRQAADSGLEGERLVSSSQVDREPLPNSSRKRKSREKESGARSSKQTFSSSVVITVDDDEDVFTQPSRTKKAYHQPGPQRNHRSPESMETIEMTHLSMKHSGMDVVGNDPLKEGVSSSSHLEMDDMDHPGTSQGGPSPMMTTSAMETCFGASPDSRRKEDTSFPVGLQSSVSPNTSDIPSTSADPSLKMQDLSGYWARSVFAHQLSSSAGFELRHVHGGGMPEADQNSDVASQPGIPDMGCLQSPAVHPFDHQESFEDLDSVFFAGSGSYQSREVHTVHGGMDAEAMEVSDAPDFLALGDLEDLQNEVSMRAGGQHHLLLQHMSGRRVSDSQHPGDPCQDSVFFPKGQTKGDDVDSVHSTTSLGQVDSFPVREGDSVGGISSGAARRRQPSSLNVESMETDALLDSTMGLGQDLVSKASQGQRGQKSTVGVEVRATRITRRQQQQQQQSMLDRDGFLLSQGAMSAAVSSALNHDLPPEDHQDAAHFIEQLFQSSSAAPASSVSQATMKTSSASGGMSQVASARSPRSPPANSRSGSVHSLATSPPSSSRAGSVFSMERSPPMSRAGPGPELSPPPSRSGPGVSLPMSPPQTRSGPGVSLPMSPPQTRTGPGVSLPMSPPQSRAGMVFSSVKSPPHTLPTTTAPMLAISSSSINRTCNHSQLLSLLQKPPLSAPAFLDQNKVLLGKTPVASAQAAAKESGGDDAKPTAKQLARSVSHTHTGSDRSWQQKGEGGTTGGAKGGKSGGDGQTGSGRGRRKYYSASSVHTVQTPTTKGAQLPADSPGSVSSLSPPSLDASYMGSTPEPASVSTRHSWDGTAPQRRWNPSTLFLESSSSSSPPQSHNLPSFIPPSPNSTASLPSVSSAERQGPDTSPYSFSGSQHHSHEDRLPDDVAEFIVESMMQRDLSSTSNSGHEGDCDSGLLLKTEADPCSKSCDKARWVDSSPEDDHKMFTVPTTPPPPKPRASESNPTLRQRLAAANRSTSLPAPISLGYTGGAERGREVVSPIGSLPRSSGGDRSVSPVHHQPGKRRHTSLDWMQEGGASTPSPAASPMAAGLGTGDDSAGSPNAFQPIPNVSGSSPGSTHQHHVPPVKPTVTLGNTAPASTARPRSTPSASGTTQPPAKSSTKLQQLLVMKPPTYEEAMQYRGSGASGGSLPRPVSAPTPSKKPKLEQGMEPDCAFSPGMAADATKLGYFTQQLVRLNEKNMTQEGTEVVQVTSPPERPETRHQRSLSEDAQGATKPRATKVRGRQSSVRGHSAVKEILNRPTRHASSQGSMPVPHSPASSPGAGSIPASPSTPLPSVSSPGSYSVFVPSPNSNSSGSGSLLPTSAPSTTQAGGAAAPGKMVGNRVPSSMPAMLSGLTIPTSQGRQGASGFNSLDLPDANYMGNAPNVDLGKLQGKIPVPMSRVITTTSTTSCSNAQLQSGGVVVDGQGHPMPTVFLPRISVDALTAHHPAGGSQQTQPGSSGENRQPMPPGQMSEGLRKEVLSMLQRDDPQGSKLKQVLFSSLVPKQASLETPTSQSGGAVGPGSRRASASSGGQQPQVQLDVNKPSQPTSLGEVPSQVNTEINTPPPNTDVSTRLSLSRNMPSQIQAATRGRGKNVAASSTSTPASESAAAEPQRSGQAGTGDDGAGKAKPVSNHSNAECLTRLLMNPAKTEPLGPQLSSCSVASSTNLPTFRRLSESGSTRQPLTVRPPSTSGVDLKGKVEPGVTSSKGSEVKSGVAVKGERGVAGTRTVNQDEDMREFLNARLKAGVSSETTKVVLPHGAGGLEQGGGVAGGLTAAVSREIPTILDRGHQRLILSIGDSLERSGSIITSQSGTAAAAGGGGGQKQGALSVASANISAASQKQREAAMASIAANHTNLVFTNSNLSSMAAAIAIGMPSGVLQLSTPEQLMSADPNAVQAVARVPVAGQVQGILGSPNQITVNQTIVNISTANQVIANTKAVNQITGLLSSPNQVSGGTQPSPQQLQVHPAQNHSSLVSAGQNFSQNEAVSYSVAHQLPQSLTTSSLGHVLAGGTLAGGHHIISAQSLHQNLPETSMASGGGSVMSHDPNTAGEQFSNMVGDPMSAHSQAFNADDLQSTIELLSEIDRDNFYQASLEASLHMGSGSGGGSDSAQGMMTHEQLLALFKGKSEGDLQGQGSNNHTWPNTAT